MCKCGYRNDENAKFCSECGLRIEYIDNNFSLPRMLTVGEAHKIIFTKKISLTKLYDLIRTRALPHVNANGKILLDVERTVKWWENKLDESTEPLILKGLRKII